MVLAIAVGHVIPIALGHLAFPPLRPHVFVLICMAPLAQDNHDKAVSNVRMVSIKGGLMAGIALSRSTSRALLGVEVFLCPFAMGIWRGLNKHAGDVVTGSATPPFSMV